MKPYIIKVDESGKPVMTAQEIQDLIEAAYTEGYKDGQKQIPTITVPTYEGPNLEWWKKVQYSDHTTPLNGYHSDCPRKDITNAMPYNPEAYKVYCSNAGGTNSAG